MLPQIIMIVLIVVGFLCNQALAGQRMAKFNVFQSALSIAISAALLTWGGFFAEIGTPQILYITMYTLSFTLSGMLHGKHPTSKRSALAGVLSYAAVIALQYWGGFYDVMI